MYTVKQLRSLLEGYERNGCADLPVVFTSSEVGGAWPHDRWKPMVLGTDEQVGSVADAGGERYLEVSLLLPTGQDWTRLPARLKDR